MDWTVFPLNSSVESLTSNVIAFEDGAFKEVINIKWDCKGET